MDAKINDIKVADLPQVNWTVDKEYIGEIRDYKSNTRLILDEDGGEVFREPINKSKAGLYKKFSVTRVDGSDAPGGKHENCDYFVLDLTHDKFALVAIRAYASACALKYPVLSEELKKKYGSHL